MRSQDLIAGAPGLIRVVPHVDPCCCLRIDQHPLIGHNHDSRHSGVGK